MPSFVLACLSFNPHSIIHCLYLQKVHKEHRRETLTKAQAIRTADEYNPRWFRRIVIGMLIGLLVIGAVFSVMLYLSPEATGRELAPTQMMTMIDGVPQKLMLANEESSSKRIPAQPPL
jgi:hypothetical protein